jgi:hypothetical protein
VSTLGCAPETAAARSQHPASAGWAAVLVQQVAAVVPQQLACGLSPQHALACACVLSWLRSATPAADDLFSCDPMIVSPIDDRQYNSAKKAALVECDGVEGR